MAVSFKVALQKAGLKPFKYRWVLIAACATFAWLSLRSSPDAPRAPAVSGQTTSAQNAAPTTANSGTAGTTARGAQAHLVAVADKPVSSASFGLSTINVIVHPNDTLDAIFRRLKLSLTDLASLRGLPGLKAHLDRLRPGESLRFLHRDGSLFGL